MGVKIQPLRSSRSSNSSFRSRRTNALSKRAVCTGIDKAQLAELYWPHTQLRANSNNESIMSFFFKHRVRSIHAIRHRSRRSKQSETRHDRSDSFAILASMSVNNLRRDAMIIAKKKPRYQYSKSN